MVLGMANGPRLNGPNVPFTVAAYIMAWGSMGGPFEDAAMNPIRVLGPDVALDDLSTNWVYVVGPLSGAAIAVLVARFLCGPAPACTLAGAPQLSPWSTVNAGTGTGQPRPHPWGAPG